MGRVKKSCKGGNYRSEIRSVNSGVYTRTHTHMVEIVPCGPLPVLPRSESTLQGRTFPHYAAIFHGVSPCSVAWHHVDLL